jgi:hypothetical protein
MKEMIAPFSLSIEKLACSTIAQFGSLRSHDRVMTPANAASESL